MESFELEFLGESETKYKFTIYPIHNDFTDIRAVYCFLSEDYDVLYVGESKQIKTRFSNHHQTECIDNNGGVYVGILEMPRSTKKTRVDIETDIRHFYDPPCNEQGISNPDEED